MTTKYVVMPEPHIWDKNIKTRIDYVKEIKAYMQEKKELLETLRNQCDKLVVIWIGDIFHKGFTNLDEFGYWMVWFMDIRGLVDEQFSLIGNHEISYYKHNPFWHLVAEIEDPSISLHPRGQVPIIRVVDKIHDSGWDIYFNHFNIFQKPTKEDKNIGLFHSSIIDDEIARTLRDKYGRDPLEHFIDHSYIRQEHMFKNYDHAVVGHMHKAFSLFTLEYPDAQNTRLRYLGSTGRTNSNEVNDNDLTRVVPIYTITADGNCTVEEYTLTLWNRDKTVREDLVEAQSNKSKEQSERKEYKRNTRLVADPMYTLRESFSSSNLAQVIINTASKGEQLPELQELLRGED